MRKIRFLFLLTISLVLLFSISSYAWPDGVTNTNQAGSDEGQQYTADDGNGYTAIVTNVDTSNEDLGMQQSQSSGVDTSVNNNQSNDVTNIAAVSGSNTSSDGGSHTASNPPISHEVTNRTDGSYTESWQYENGGEQIKNYDKDGNLESEDIYYANGTSDRKIYGSSISEYKEVSYTSTTGVTNIGKYVPTAAGDMIFVTYTAPPASEPESEETVTMLSTTRTEQSQDIIPGEPGGTEDHTGGGIFTGMENIDNSNGSQYGGSSIGTDGSLTTTIILEDGTTQDITFSNDGLYSWTETVTDDNGEDVVLQHTISATRSLDYRGTGLGYDWAAENFTDVSSPQYGSPVSLTPNHVRSGQRANHSFTNPGDLLPVGEGVFSYKFVHYGDHQMIITPYWNIDVYEEWDEVHRSTNPDGTESTYTEDCEQYMYSYIETREPVVYYFQVPLICTTCEGVQICVGGGCADDCTGSLFTICDNDHLPQITIDSHVQLER